MSIALALLHVVGEKVLRMNHQWPVTKWRSTACRGTYVTPSHQIIGGLTEVTNDRVLHDTIGNVKIIGIFNECPARFASVCVTTKGNIWLQVRNSAILAVKSLLSHGLKEEVECRDETLLGSSRRRTQESSPIAESNRYKYWSWGSNEKKNDLLLCHPANSRRSMVSRMIQSIHHSICSRLGASHVHVIWKIVEMKQVCSKDEALGMYSI